jgi:hypothetical protein
VFTAYLDESGQEQPDWMFIAGYVGDEAAWTKFPELWAKAIGPQRTHLHMNSLRFQKLHEQRMLARAALVPKQCGLIPILVAARLKDYADMLTLEGDSLIHAAYILCCKTAVFAALKAVPSNERLEIVLERQDRYRLIAEYEIEKISKSTEVPELLLMEDGKTPKLANWRFIEKKDSALCEPADYLAYAAFQAVRNKNSVRTRWTYPIIAADPKAGFSAAVRRETAKIVVANQRKDKILKTLETLKQMILEASKQEAEASDSLTHIDRPEEQVSTIQGRKKSDEPPDQTERKR